MVRRYQTRPNLVLKNDSEDLPPRPRSPFAKAVSTRRLDGITPNHCPLPPKPERAKNTQTHTTLTRVRTVLFRTHKALRTLPRSYQYLW
mmetsp:Transcript_21692/g.60388  ORF Transcript_21692/g.60388 Transcript_21692/m.60388 type:complete len:89 (+) Transcript_21692:58-324(+)